MRFSRRNVFILLALAALGLGAAHAADQNSGKYLGYVGTYTDGKSKGIYVFRYDAASGETSTPELAVESANPSWLLIHPNSQFLYAVNEVVTYEGESSGAISAYKIDRSTGKLTLLNRVASGGADPCYLGLDRTGKSLFVANYTGGSVAVFQLHGDGSIGARSSFVQHQGSGPRKEQDAPHAHWIETSPDNRYAFAVDLGADRIVTYHFDAAEGSLLPAEFRPRIRTGDGPRHMAFHPNGKYAYLINEITSAVTVYSYDPTQGALLLFQRIEMMPDTYTGRKEAAEIQVHPSGKFLYASTRGADVIVVFSIDAKTGGLKRLENVPTGAKEPRHFIIDPTGTRLFVGNKDVNTISIFNIDPNTGRLTPTNRKIEVPVPIAIQFVKVE